MRRRLAAARVRRVEAPKRDARRWFRRPRRGVSRGCASGPAARYAAEEVRYALDHDDRRAAGRFVRRVKAVQDVLGGHHDAVVAASEIRRLAQRTRPSARSTSRPAACSNARFTRRPRRGTGSSRSGRRWTGRSSSGGSNPERIRPSGRREPRCPSSRCPGRGFSGVLGVWFGAGHGGCTSWMLTGALSSASWTAASTVVFLACFLIANAVGLALLYLFRQRQDRNSYPAFQVFLLDDRNPRVPGARPPSGFLYPEGVPQGPGRASRARPLVAPPVVAGVPGRTSTPWRSAAGRAKATGPSAGGVGGQPW